MRLVRWSLLGAVVVLAYTFCHQPQLKDRDFVGKWRSSRLQTPLYLYANGEWEIKKNDGAILQYGVWRYEDHKLIWSLKLGTYIKHDVNPVLSYKPRQFKLREQSGETTVFDRLE